MRHKRLEYQPETKPTLNGFIAFIDILGFRDIIQKRQFKETFDLYSGFIKYAISLDDYHKVDPNYVVFSDTIVINTIYNSKTAFDSLLFTCSKIYFKMIQLGIPIRGCITCGEYERFEDDRKGIVIAGKPIIEAYDYERIQNWIGIMVSPSVLDALPDLPENLKIGQSSRLQRNIKENMPSCLFCQRGMIPFHSKLIDTTTFDGYAVIPTEINCATPNDLLISLRKAISALDLLIIRAPSLEAQQKYRNTLLFFKKTKRTWENIIDDKVVHGIKRN